MPTCLTCVVHMAVGGRAWWATRTNTCMCLNKHAIGYAAEHCAVLTLCRAPAVVSREEVEAEKARLRAIDLRPIKKIAEAKARKKKRLAVRARPSCLHRSTHVSAMSEPKVRGLR